MGILGNSTVQNRAAVEAALAAATNEDALPYLVYTAILSQSGTNAPVAVILQNTLGTIVYSYNGPGSYTGTLTGAFTNLKTAIFLSPSYSDVSASNDYLDVVSVTRASADTINIYTGGVTALGSRDSENSVLFHQIEIRVYA